MTHQAVDVRRGDSGPELEGADTGWVVISTDGKVGLFPTLFGLVLTRSGIRLALFRMLFGRILSGLSFVENGFTK
jgi:hypothetical protein